MIAFFDPEDIVKTVGLEGLDMGSIGTQAVFGNDERKMGVVLAQLGYRSSENELEIQDWLP
jgi:hypothetical protein